LLASKAFEEQCRGRLTKVIIETDCARVYLAVKSDSQIARQVGDRLHYRGDKRACVPSP
jgi:hypothetical protein